MFRTIENRDSETEKILKACDAHSIPSRGRELRALTLLMLRTGIRIGDAVTLSKDRIQKGMLKLRTTKTGTDVEVPLHPDVVAALGKLAAASGYYFWDGLSNQQTLVKLWDAAFMRLFKRAGIAAGHCHRFRHTFATRLLQKGISMESLATLLGHRDTKITQRHYAAWVPAGRRC
jgi:integrase